MQLLQLRSIFNGSSVAIAGKANELLRPIAATANVRFITSEEKKKLKLDKKLAKKLAAKASQPPVAEYIKQRVSLWPSLKKQYAEQLAAKPQQSVKITLPDGVEVDGEAWKTTPFEVARGISSGLASDSIVAKVNDVLWDMERPVEADTQIELLKIEETEAQATVWLSTAFVLGEVLERLYGVDGNGLLCGIGVTEKGFYADIHLESGSIDLPAVTSTLDKTIRTPFERIEVPKSDALKLFEYNKFQQRLIEAIGSENVPVYRCGSAFGVGSLPHMRHAKKIKCYKLLKTETAHFNNKEGGEPVHRITGVSFLSDSALADFVRKQGGK